MAAIRRHKARLGIVAKLEADLRGTRERSHCNGLRALLRHGPRQALGPCRESLSRDRRGDGIATPNAKAAIEASYAEGKTDEFVLPRVIAGYTRHEGWRWAAVRQFPRRPRAPDS